MRTPRRALAVAALLSAAPLAAAQSVVLWDNGPIVTNPTGGTGSIAGLPISQPDAVPSGFAPFTGLGSTIAANTAAAEDFTIPDTVGGWDLSTLTLFAFQTGQTTAVVSAVRINIWTAPPFSAGSPAPLPDPLPQPMLMASLEIPASPGTFVCHRQGSATSTSTSRPVFSYSFVLDGLPNGGVLPPGTYWLEWSMAGAGTGNVFNPLVTPRTAAPSLNLRLYNQLGATGTRDWFESREAFQTGVSDGRPVALPFILRGTVIPLSGACCSGTACAVVAGSAACAGTYRGNGSACGPAGNPTTCCPANYNGVQGVDLLDIFAFLQDWFAGNAAADFNGQNGVDLLDIFAFLGAWFAGCP